MTPTDLRESLTEIRDAVAVPPVDLVRFDDRVRHHRRLLRVRRTVAAASAIAAVAGVVAVVPHVLPRPESIPVASEGSAVGVPVVLDGRVQEVGPGGSLTDTGLSGRPLGRLAGRLVVLDGHRLLGVGDAPIEDVVTAYVDPTGVTYQTTDGLIVFTGEHGQRSAQGPGTLLAGSATLYVDDEGHGPLIHAADGIHPVDLGSDGTRVELDRVEAAGRTVVFVHDGQVEVYGADGERRDGLLGGTTGALSADGTTYAYAPDGDELANGMAAGLTFYDTRSSDARSVPLADAAVDLAWYDGDLYVLTQGNGERALWRCDTDACDRVLTAPGSTLSLE